MNGLYAKQGKEGKIIELPLSVLVNVQKDQLGKPWDRGRVGDKFSPEGTKAAPEMNLCPQGSLILLYYV